MRTALIIPALCLLLAGCGNSIGTASSLPAISEKTTAAQTTAPRTMASAQTTAEQTTTASVTATEQTSASSDSRAEEQGILISSGEIGLYDTDGGGMNYSFTYNGETFSAVYTAENWKIVDSYKITNSADMKFICEALIAVHPLHGKDYQSFRTADDMVFEWQEHNSAYFMLPEDSEWKKNVKDVDFNPEDQGKTGVEMALDRLRGR